MWLCVNARAFPRPRHCYLLFKETESREREKIKKWKKKNERDALHSTQDTAKKEKELC